MPRFLRRPALLVLAGFVLLLPIPSSAGADLDEGHRKAVVEAATKYFDLGEDAWRGRKAFLAALEEVGKDVPGYDLMGDMPALKDVIYRSRYFEPQMSDKRWQKAHEVREYDAKGRMQHVRTEEVYVNFTLPQKYPNKNKKFDKQPRLAPYPVIISTIEREDYTGKKRPGFELIERRFPKKQWGDFLNRWITLVPIAPGGVYVDSKTGRVKREYLIKQFVQFVRHYHVDFDRVILDGGQEVLLSASSQPLMYAGFVLRHGTLDKSLAKTVMNFAHVPVYVVTGQEKLAEDLKQAGHPNVTVGDAGDTLAKWCDERRRTVPKKFDWHLAGAQHQFAYWINCEQVHWGPDNDAELTASVDEKTNTINITAKAIREISLFLNDDVVDLGKPVKVVVNGHLEREETVQRNLDILFSRDPLKLRESMYFGLLFPARIVRIEVRAPVKAVVEKPTTPSASPEDEAKAQKYFEGAKGLVDQGKLDAARKRLDAIVALGNTSYLERARKLLAELGK